MNITGIVRRVDDLGRIQIPKEIRQRLKIKEGQPLEIVVIGEIVLIGKFDESEVEEV